IHRQRQVDQLRARRSDMVDVSVIGPMDDDAARLQVPASIEAGLMIAAAEDDGDVAVAMPVPWNARPRVEPFAAICCRMEVRAGRHSPSVEQPARARQMATRPGRATLGALGAAPPVSD